MAQTVRILLVDYGVDDAELIIREVQRAGFDPEWQRVEGESEFEAALRNPPDVILCDYAVPGFGGLRSVGLLRERGLNTPLIFVSGTMDEATAIEAIKRGANDCLRKDRLGRLGSAIHRSIEERQLRDAHRHAEEQARLQARALDAVANAVVITDRRGHARWVNAAFTRMTGYEPEEVLGKNLRVLKSGCHESTYYQALWRTILDGQVWEGEMVNRRKDGSLYPEYMTITPMRGSDGAISHYIAIKQDFTERKHFEAELRSNEERFRLLIENASDLITVINLAGIIRFQSPSSTRILGFAPGDLLGRSAFEIIHPDDAAQAKAAIQRAVANADEPASVEYRIRHRNGQWLTFQSIGSNIPGQAEDGFIVVNSRDVTEQRLLEAQLRQSQKMEAIGVLAGGVAHDFNNILAAMMIQAELVGMIDNLPREIRDGLQQIQGYAERAANLTRQLLLFSRRQVMQARDLDLNESIASLAKMLQRIIGEDVRLQLQLHPGPLPTHADAGMLDQVLMNLAVNARDAMPEGGRLLIKSDVLDADADFARLHPDAHPGRFVFLSVSDTGCGIPPDILPRIFEPFFTTKDAGKGTGLGLATVFGIVKQHRGFIEVQSEPGRGTSFHVYLPSVDSDAAVADYAAARAKPQGGNETILLVEDEPAVRTLTRTLLEHRGYNVLEAGNAIDALAIWREHRASVSLLLTDMVLPAGMNGQRLARRIQVEAPGLKVIFASGYSAEIAGKEIELRGGENFLQKPFTPDQLFQTIRRCLDG